jgi:hypothetical protein
MPCDAENFLFDHFKSIGIPVEFLLYLNRFSASPTAAHRSEAGRRSARVKIFWSFSIFFQNGDRFTLSLQPAQRSTIANLTDS